MNMNFTQSSPPSLGPPRRISLPQPTRPCAMPPDHSENPTGLPQPSLPNPRSPVSLRARYSFSTIGTPSIVYNLNVLSEYLERRPARDGISNKVIAVDGLDRNAVHMVISELHYNLVANLRCTVRVLSEDFPQRPINESSDLAHYVSQIHNWAAMWGVVFEASPPTSNTRPRPSESESSHVHPRPCPSDRLCIWIMPLSPLMVTLRAATRISLTGTYGPSDLWRWLASHWAGYLKPDITVNVQDIADTATKREVLRFEGNNMNTLLVTKLRDSDTLLSPRQLRRVTFEVEDWIQGEGGFGGHNFT